MKKSDKPQEAELPIRVPYPILQYYVDRNGWTKPKFLSAKQMNVRIFSKKPENLIEKIILSYPISYPMLLQITLRPLD